MACRSAPGGITTLSLKRHHLRRPDVLFASGFGLGFLPRAPGTWGSLGALFVWWFGLVDLSLAYQFSITLLCFFVGWWCSRRISHFFSTDDAAEIVADEVVGMWVALMLLPKIWWIALVAFVMFRLLDIAKPSVIGWLDREVKGGLGVMLDDMMAGLITGGVLYVLVLVLQSQGWINP
jgi:phosphatidylglycerophosphatase A